MKKKQLFTIDDDDSRVVFGEYGAVNSINI